MRIKILFETYEQLITNKANSETIFTNSGMINDYQKLDFGFFPLGSGILSERSNIDDASITVLKPKILAFMRERHTIHPDDERAVGNFDLFEEFQKVQDLFMVLKFIAYFVGTLVLLSGIIGISNIMLIVVKERTNEIGVRRALGATPGAIRSQILLEAIFLTIIAGMFGIAVATGLLAILNMILATMPTEGMMFINPSVDLMVVFTALLILVGSGLLAGFIPAQTAINVKPVDALRAE